MFNDFNVWKILGVTLRKINGVFLSWSEENTSGLFFYNSAPSESRQEWIFWCVLCFEMRSLFWQLNSYGICKESRLSHELGKLDLQAAQRLKARVKIAHGIRKPELLCKMMLIVLMNDSDDITLSAWQHLARVGLLTGALACHSFEIGGGWLLHQRSLDHWLAPQIWHCRNSLPLQEADWWTRVTWSFRGHHWKFGGYGESNFIFYEGYSSVLEVHVGYVAWQVVHMLNTM